MIEVNERIWNPNEDILYETYTNLTDSQKLEVWYRVYVDEGIVKRLKIVIPSGLKFLRELWDGHIDLLSHDNVVDATKILFLDYFENVLVELDMSDVTCIRILDDP